MKNQSELAVITAAKDLCTYVMTVTQKSPKHYRYTFVDRIQNMTLDIKVKQDKYQQYYKKVEKKISELMDSYKSI